MLIIFIAARITPSIAPREMAPSWRVRFIGLLSLFPIFVLMFLVLGTIYLGVATPTEAAAFGVVGAFVLVSVEVVVPSLARFGNSGLLTYISSHWSLLLGAIVLATALSLKRGIVGSLAGNGSGEGSS